MLDTPQSRLRIRRARRTDFTDVMRLVAAAGATVPPPDRATLRRFRALVNDLGGDFYLAFFDRQLAGLVHTTFARRLGGPPAARLEELIVAAAWRRRGVGSRLLAFVAARARRRGCAVLACAPGPDDTAAAAFLEASGLLPRGRRFDLALEGTHTQ